MKIEVWKDVRRRTNDFSRKTIYLVEFKKSATKHNRNLCEKETYTKTFNKDRRKIVRLREMSIEEVRMIEAIWRMLWTWSCAVTRAFEELITDLELSPLNVVILRDLIHFKVSIVEQGEPKL